MQQVQCSEKKFKITHLTLDFIYEACDFFVGF